jgi:hypothetical protein
MGMVMRDYRQFLMECIRCAAKGSVGGALNWSSIVGALIVGAIFAYRGEVIVFGNDWKGEVVSAVVYAAAAWLLFFLLRVVLVCPYQMWRQHRDRGLQLEERLRPKIVLSFGRIKAFRKPVTFLDDDGKLSGHGVSIRVRADAVGSTVEECQAWVVGIERETFEGFEQISPYEPIKLPLALEGREFEPSPLVPGISKYFGVVTSMEHWAFFRIRSERTSHSDPPHFTEPGTYRVQTIVRGKESPTAELLMEIVWNGNWSEIEAREVPHPPVAQ